MKYKCKLTKLSKNEGGFRGTTMEGMFWDLPVSGLPFTVYGEPIDKNMNFRVVNTSTVQEVEHRGKELIIKTLNSVYSLEVLESYSE